MNTTIVVFSTAVPAIIAGCESQTMKRTKLLALSVCCLAVLRTLGASAASDDAATARVIEELGLRESAVAQRDRPGWSKPQKVLLMGADAARSVASPPTSSRFSGFTSRCTTPCTCA